jgi:hypothetical protein
MKPLIILYGLSIFILCLMFHVRSWRRNRPRNEPAALFVNFLIAPLLLLLVLCFSPWKTIGLADASAVYLYHFAIAGAYISSYPAVQAYSPSLEILMLFRGREAIGLTKGEILETFDQVGIVADRVRDLKASRLVVEENGKFRLSFGGHKIALAYKLYRCLLGLPIKGK